jgi:hypothetical protein
MIDATLEVPVGEQILEEAAEAERKARRFLSFLIEHVEAAKRYDGMEPTERDEIELAGGQIVDAFEQLSKFYVEPFRDRENSVLENGYLMLWQLAGAAFVIGSRGTISKSIEKATHRLRQRASGNASGNVRQQKAQQWKNQALELSRAAREKKPSLSQSQIVEHVLKTWKSGVPKPRHNTLLQFVAQNIRSGELPAKAVRRSR